MGCFTMPVAFALSGDEEPQPSATAAPPPQAVNPAKPSVQEAELSAEAPRVTRSSVKKVAVSRSTKKAKKSKEADVSLEAHEPASSSDNALMKKFIALGTKCTQYWKVAKASEDALASANARIASLEAELIASQKAFDSATTAKANAEKLHKAAVAKAKKAEKALADANKERLQREQAVAERLNTISAAAGESTKASLSTPQPGDDPLLAAVNLLEANWISIQDIFELVSRVLSRMFVGLWPKKKAEVPVNDLNNLAKAFDTNDDPLLQLKGLSVKRGVEGAIALSYAHGADLDWEKIGSPHGRTRSELKPFFKKAKKLTPAIVSIISPSAAAAVSLTPTPSTPTVATAVPPSTADTEGIAPSVATEQHAEVA